MDINRYGFALAAMMTLAMACLSWPTYSHAGNVFFGRCEGQLAGRMLGPFADRDLSIRISNSGSCTGSDGDFQVAQGTNAGGGYGEATWQAQMTREIEYLAPGVFVHRGIGSSRVTASQRGFDNGTFFQNHPYVESGVSGSSYRVFFTVDAPTPIRLKAQVTALVDNGGNFYEDSFTLHENSAVIWRLDGTLDPGNVTDGEVQYVLVPGKSYFLQFTPVARAQVASCGSGGCSGNPDLYERSREDYTNWSYELTFNYAPPVVDLASLSLKQAEVAGCKSVTGTVTLTSPAPGGGFIVTLADTLAAAVTPAAVTVPAGALTKTFSIKTIPVSSLESGSVSATGAEESLTQPLSVRPIGLTSITLTPTSVAGGNPVTGKATLECKAGPGAVLVDLESSNPAAGAPVAASIAVPQGLQATNFDVATNPVLAKTTTSISGTANSIKKSKTLTVNVAAAVSPTSLKFGIVTVGTTSGVLNATLTNKGATAISVNSISLTGTSASWFAQSHNCPASLPAGESCTIAVTFKPLAVLSKSAKLTIATSATSTPLSVSLSGAGI